MKLQVLAAAALAAGKIFLMLKKQSSQISNLVGDMSNKMIIGRNSPDRPNDNVCQVVSSITYSTVNYLFLEKIHKNATVILLAVYSSVLNRGHGRLFGTLTPIIACPM